MLRLRHLRDLRHLECLSGHNWERRILGGGVLSHIDLESGQSHCLCSLQRGRAFLIERLEISGTDGKVVNKFDFRSRRARGIRENRSVSAEEVRRIVGKSDGGIEVSCGRR